MNSETTRREFLATTAGAGLGLAMGPYFNLKAVLAEEIANGRLLHRIDCTQELPPEKYFANGDVKVVEGPAGRYREAQGVPLSRFGYRFPIEHVGRPHVAVIRYPDDKQRFMCIMDGTCYDLTTGVFTGWAQPLSGAMLELRQVFWPRWQDCSIVLTTWSEGEPAAAASIEIHELADLPPLSVPGDPGDGSRRELGIQYEDPCGIGGAEGAMNHREWIDRVVQYARHSGQNLLVYPLAWYAGPQFPSQREPSDGLNIVVARDRKQYSVWTTHPADWYATLLERFGKEGLQFQGSLTLMRLGNLLKNMDIDLEAIRGGADTYNNMLWNNRVQSSTNDWTPFYNALNFKRLTEENKDKKPLEPWGTLSRNVYGEVANPGGGGPMGGPMFNPLHPTVQEAILGFVEEIGRRYGKYPAFQGISFNMFASAMPWFGSIRFGYDDYSVALFEKETGTAVPVDAKAPDRFSQRYEFLTKNHRADWVAWRCRKIRELFGRIHQALAAARPDLRVTVTLWDETVVPHLKPAGYPSSLLRVYREAGIDVDLYRNEPGLEVDRGIGNSRDRGGGESLTKGVNAPLEASTTFRDFDFLDQEFFDAFRQHDRPGAFIFNCWVEAWGRHIWFRPEDGDPNLPALAVMDGKPAEGIFRINSEYPKDGFWWDSQLRITPSFPAGVHFLEPYAHALAEFDACRITRGGLFLDKAHGEELRQFARAYRALPRLKFAAVGASTDPVVLRALAYDGRRYFYAVNRDYYPVKVDVAFSARPKGAEDLATGERLDLPQRWSVVLGPYELRSLAVAPETEIVGFKATPPEDVVRGLRAETEQALAAFGKVRAAGKSLPGMDELEKRIRAALADGKPAWLRRALASYIVRKAKRKD
ncbi:MAG: family 10 glycosylhydrolase [Planctomycetes bacterium]|nr:family 10 glycosylhydrolase [Planctomycetota bacterium]